MNLYLAVRWVHVLAAASWYGEVVTINLVLVPMLGRLEGVEQRAFLRGVFPRLFKLASWLSLTAVVSGAYLAWVRYGSDLSQLATPQGRVFLLGATLALALTAFHFILEPRLDGMICSAHERDDVELTDRVVRALRIVPRGGLLVITGIVVSMMIGSRGW